MSLKYSSSGSVPVQTARVARAAFPKGNVYLKLRDEFGTIYDDADFESLFSTRGRPAESPVRLALIVVFQFLEGLSDRAAADAVRSRIDWKYVLGLELEDAGFDASILTEFRARLIEEEAAQLLFDKLLAKLQNTGFVKAKGMQRTDSTRVLAAVHDYNRLECVWEAMRSTLEVLAQIVPHWLEQQTAADWFDRYRHRPEGYKMSEAKREALFEQIGADGTILLEAVYAASPEIIVLSSFPQVEILRRIWVQQFYLEADKIKKRKTGNQPPASVMISSPYDCDTRLSSKREQEWHGYKVHLTETIVKNDVQLITNVHTTKATLTDKEALPEIQAELGKRNLLPEKQVVDAGYVTAKQIVDSREKHGIDLFGPMMRDGSWQAKAGKGFAGSDFSIDWENKRAMCPRGKQSHYWRQVRAADYDMEIIYIEFLKSDCSACQVRADCTTSKTQRRRVTISTQPYYEAMQGNRKRQESAEFKREYQQRAGIEGTISQGVRSFEMRKTRYRGMEKTRFQHYASATAMNIARLGAWWSGVPRERTRESAFQKLRMATA